MANASLPQNNSEPEPGAAPDIYVIAMTSEIEAAAKQTMEIAKRASLTIVTAESCTSGLLAAALSRVPGAGDHLHGGFVTYTKQHKTAALGVPEHLLKEKTAVHGDVALAMAEGALSRSPADIAVAITGVAGPDSDEDGNPVGLVYIAVARKGRDTAVFEKHYPDCGHDGICDAAMRDALAAVREAAC
jgi:nicotinamide-nucleotide amidase